MRLLLALAFLLSACQSAASSSAPVNPSGPGTTATTTPTLSGAPSSLVAVPKVPASPKPSGGIGLPASYCKPQFCETPEPEAPDGIAGQATWWNSFGSGLYAALRPDLGSKGDLVIVCGGEPFHCVTAPVITSCACLGPNSDRLVDLSADLFREFAPLSAGVVRITLQVVGREP